MEQGTGTGLEQAEVIVINEGVGCAEVEMIPAEEELVFSVNDEVEARFCCAPHRVRSLAIGWLVGEGIIEEPNEFLALETDLETNLVSVTVEDSCLERMQDRIVSTPRPTLADVPFPRRADTELEIAPGEVNELGSKFRQLFLSLKSTERMCYLAALANRAEVLTYGEGFHRINALYRAMGELVSNNRTTDSKIALCNYGLSRMMVNKLARAGVGLAICFAPPTSSAIELANDYYLTICVAGLGEDTRVYSAPWRVI